ncbi:MAG: hypothetical protein OXI87_04300 [Albidovulum sp.]|nr:hypothetical protein [Albidovulum sp.]MDE0304098.1 hypothetical protein [Albidovulum sp.]MDE0533365.1 hypothetical protein [Albidovulum sp.]
MSESASKFTGHLRVSEETQDLDDILALAKRADLGRVEFVE